MNKNKQVPGTFVISLDFELFWGVHDVFEKNKYEEHVHGAQQVVLSLLEKFKVNKIHATWAIVGMMYCGSTEELDKYMPRHKPTYITEKLSPYCYLVKNPINEADFDLFFAPFTIQRIRSTQYQEIATHTFSHYYCLEKGQTKEQFLTDVQQALRLAQLRGSEIKSIVFPRNQINSEYLGVCRRLGIMTYRGNEENFIYRLQSNERRKIVKRGLRLLDSYVNVFGHQTYKLSEIVNELPINIKSSRFLKPYSSKLRRLESLRLKRILNDMTYAAKKGEVYHLWWHPHNFGVNTEKNMEFLQKILEHYLYLNKVSSFRSRNMHELAMEKHDTCEVSAIND